MTLDSLHKVMTGESTLDKEKQIGEISQRKDGLYKKIAPGKWAPVKAAGNVREFSETENHGAQLERQKKADAQAKKDEAVREQRAQGEAVGKSWKTAAEEWIKKNPNYKEMSADDIIKGISEYMAAEEQKPAETNPGAPAFKKGQKVRVKKEDAVVVRQGAKEKRLNETVQSHLENNKDDYADYSQYDIEELILKPSGYRLVDKGRKDGSTVAEYSNGKKTISVKYSRNNEFRGVLAENKQETEGPDTSLQHERNGQIFKSKIRHTIPMSQEDYVALTRIGENFEGGRWVAVDAIDNYADQLIKERREKGNDTVAQERAVMKIAHAIGYGHELHDKIKKARDGYDFGYDDEQGSFYEEDNEQGGGEKANPYKRDQDDFMSRLSIYSNKIKDPSKVSVKRTPQGNWQAYYNGSFLGTFGGDTLDPEAAEELGWWERPAPDFADDAAPGIVKKTVELAQRDYKDVPGRVLTADTKIRLSRIRREQTQDKTYNVGETSQRKDGLYKKIAPGKWAPVKAGGSAGAPAGGKAEVNPGTGKPLRPETVAYAQQKKAEAEQKRNTEKTAGGFTLAQNDKIKNAATDVIFKRRGEKLTPADLQREYKMSEPEAKEASRRINEYFSSLEKDRQEFAKAGEKKAQNARPQASPMAGAPRNEVERISDGSYRIKGTQFYFDNKEDAESAVKINTRYGASVARASKDPDVNEIQDILNFMIDTRSSEKSLDDFIRKTGKDEYEANMWSGGSNTSNTLIAPLSEGKANMKIKKENGSWKITYTDKNNPGEHEIKAYNATEAKQQADQVARRREAAALTNGL